jgi:hypothetical protein
MKPWLSLAVLATVAGCSGSTPPKPPVATASAIPPRPTATATAARSCVELSRIREARVVDDRTIDFYLSSREILRNTLPSACPQLGFEKAFTYSTSLSQLCSVDIITVIVQGGGPRRGASCGLGAFVPYTPVQK